MRVCVCIDVLRDLRDWGVGLGPVQAGWIMHALQSFVTPLSPKPHCTHTTHPQQPRRLRVVPQEAQPELLRGLVRLNVQQRLLNI